MSQSVPFLARVSETASRGADADLPALNVGRDGLLRRNDTGGPFINELLEAAGNGSRLLGTFVTESNTDEVDPDTVRFDQRRFSISVDRLATFFTRAPEESDPDAIRGAYVLGMATSFTSGHVDQPDPDIIRRS